MCECSVNFRKHIDIDHLTRVLFLCGLPDSELFAKIKSEEVGVTNHTDVRLNLEVYIIVSSKNICVCVKYILESIAIFRPART